MEYAAIGTSYKFKSNVSTIITLLVITGVVFTVNNTFASEEKAQHSCQLTAGYDESKPFHFKNSKGIVVGLDADILREVLGTIGCQVEFKELPWSRTLTYLEDGKIDIAIGAGFKKNRAQWSYYSVPYKFIKHWLYTRADKHQDIHSIDQFYRNKLSLGVVIGWNYPPEIRRTLNIPEYSEYISKVPSFDQLPKMLDLNRVDGIIAIPETLKTEIKNSNLSHQFVSRAQYKEELHFMFSKKSIGPQIVADFNNALYNLVYSGRRDEILLRYEIE